MAGIFEKIRTEVGAVILAIGLILAILIVFGVIGAMLPVTVSTVFLIILGAGLLIYDYKVSKTPK